MSTDPKPSYKSLETYLPAVITAGGAVLASLADLPLPLAITVVICSALIGCVFIVSRTWAKRPGPSDATAHWRATAQRYKSERDAARQLAEDRKRHILKLDPHAYDHENRT